MPSTPRRAATAVAAVLTAVTLTACSSGDGARNAVAVGGTFQFHSPGGQTEIIYAEEERAPLPDFSGPSLMEEGEEISLSDFEGEVVVLNAWGQWCAPCRAEVDDLQLVQETLDPLGGTVLGINVRDYNQTIAQDFKLDNGVTYPSIYDPPFRTAADLGGVPTSVIPTTIILDKQHRPAAVFLREVDAEDVLDVALPLAKEAPAP
ncbi:MULTISPECIES: TlpA family protein disulfide reductase [Corynebacterium]|uniref:TlpA family protein disulfide reductase n=4 Tax=Corynebacterium sanguinis TaxID=2594913 RepID=A0A6C1TUN7_9CORY|nr:MULTISPECIES: TlpA disulfide reductase family protein [Corynebacterium]APT93890.1 effector protein [Corynebacterium stationis]MCT1464177.1 TlpA family protein disulfide reductase [Corynebacterium sanguinis]MCT1806297.1 TlpA family protein disulfide reductase [Corynebacterium sanguinis]MCT2330656.1 TlpA family protein disulfide reductase [Corynebacterium sanguinis]NMF33077.1 TlpA family protein disulfide reductase [Corynebacterium ammoniagenes]